MKAPAALARADGAGRDVRTGGRWSRAQRLKNDLIFGLATAALGAASRLPAPHVRALCALFADACWALGVGPRRRVEHNLRRALGAGAPGSRAVFRGLGSTLADTLALLEGGAASASGLRLEGAGRDALRRASSAGRGVVYATAHLGPWERMAALLVEEGFEVATVARESYDPRFDALYARLREARGVRPLYRGRPGFTTALVRALRRGSVVGFPMDLGGRRVRAHEARWFGLPHPTPLGPASLALRMGAGLVVGTPAPGPDGSLVVRVEEVATAGLAAGPRDVERLTEELAARLAERVAGLPTLWPWMHPKWLCARRRAAARAAAAQTSCQRSKKRSLRRDGGLTFGQGRPGAARRGRRRMERVIGIDLGTTNSCVAVMEGGAPVVIPNRGGYQTTPSMVAITEAGRRLVGHMAKRQAVTNAENTVSAAKRLIGRKWNSAQVKHAMLTSGYRVVEGPHGDVRVQLRGKAYSVPEISAMVLQEMKTVAEAYLGGPVSKAVITVPAYFNDNQRQATKDAGHIAGLEVLRIINEPTAAALAYGFGKNTERLIAVYDVGGGTFDISVLEIGGHGVFKVIATAGDTFLGGEDFDARIIDWLVQGFKEERGIDLRQDRMALQRLKDAAEKAKVELSALDEAEINLPFITSGGRNEALHLQRALPRAALESLCGDLVERTIDICRQTLSEARLPKEDIEEVILVGGMTRMPLVQRAVAQFFGREPGKGVHPDEVVALGAAIQGHALVDDAQEVLLLDVTPHALGIMTAGSRFEELIPQNTTVPTNRTKTFTTSRDNQTAVKILVLQGESEAAEQNELLGEFLLTGLRRAPKGQVEIEVTFSIDADGIVSVEATDLETGQHQSIKVTASSGLTRDELASMIESAQEYGLAQKLSEEAERTLQEAETLVADVGALLSRAERSVAPNAYGRDALDRARAALDRAARALGRRDHEALRDQLETLLRAQRMLRSLVPQGPAKGA